MNPFKLGTKQKQWKNVTVVVFVVFVVVVVVVVVVLESLSGDNEETQESTTAQPVAEEMERVGSCNIIFIVVYLLYDAYNTNRLPSIVTIYFPLCV